MILAKQQQMHFQTLLFFLKLSPFLIFLLQIFFVFLSYFFEFFLYFIFPIINSSIFLWFFSFNFFLMRGYLLVNRFYSSFSYFFHSFSVTHVNTCKDLFINVSAG